MFRKSCVDPKREETRNQCFLFGTSRNNLEDFLNTESEHYRTPASGILLNLILNGGALVVFKLFPFSHPYHKPFQVWLVADLALCSGMYSDTELYQRECSRIHDPWCPQTLLCSLACKSHPKETWDEAKTLLVLYKSISRG